MGSFQIVSSQSTFIDQGKTGELLTGNISVSDNKVKIKEIKFSGNRAFSSQMLKSQMETKETGFWGGGFYDEPILKKDLEKILRLYQGEGYAKAALVSLERKPLKNRTEIILQITLDEGVQYKIGGLSIEGNLAFTQEQIQGRLEAKQGDVFDVKKLEEDRMAIVRLYSEKGFIRAWVVPKLDFRDARRQVNVQWRLEEGTASLVEEVKIQGNIRTKDFVIRRELLIKAGDVLDTIKVEQSRQRVYNLGFFDEVRTETQRGSSEDKAVLVFYVKDKVTGTLSVGAGYGSVDGLLSFAEVSEPNFFGNGQRLSLSTQVGQHRVGFNFTFEEPWLLSVPLDYAFDLYSNQQSLPNYFYTERRGGGDLRLNYPFSGTYTSGVTYRYERVSIFNVDSSATDFIFSGESAVISLSFIQNIDRRDNRLDPSKGDTYRLEDEVAGGVFGGDNSFDKHTVDASWYFSSAFSTVLGLHVRAGYAAEFGTTPYLPVYERFFVGGTDTVRGYEERIIGPHNASGVPMGGNTLGLFNVECKVPIVANLLKWMFFYDTGEVWARPSDVFSDSFPWPDSIGTGVRLSIPGMNFLLRLDYGYGLRESLRAQGGKFHFNLGSLF